jgi:hypothetical protein
MYVLGEMKKMNIRIYNGRTNVNIRQFYIDKITKEEKAGLGGITLSVGQWKILAKHVININFVISTSSF